jgi:hypothetical protein
MFMNHDTSGKKRLEQSELVCGLHQILRSHGNGERTNVKVDDIFQTVSSQGLLVKKVSYETV